MRARRTVVAAVAVLLATACINVSEPLAPDWTRAAGETFLTTDAVEYELRVEGAARAVEFELTYRNPLRVAVAVPACHSPTRPRLEKLVDGEWVFAFAPVELMCITEPLVIPAGETHRFRYPVRAYSYDLERWAAAVNGRLEGTYRLRWWVGVHDRRADAGVGTPLPLELVVSNTFRLRAPAPE